MWKAHGYSIDEKARGGLGFITTLSWVSWFICKLKVFVLEGHLGLLRSLHYLLPFSFPILYPMHMVIPTLGPISTVVRGVA